MRNLGDLCIHIRMLKIGTTPLAHIYNMCGAAATHPSRKYLARFRSCRGGKAKTNKGRTKFSSLAHGSMLFFCSLPNKLTLRKLLALLTPASCRIYPTPRTPPMSVTASWGSEIGSFYERARGYQQKMSQSGPTGKEAEFLDNPLPSVLFFPPRPPISAAFLGLQLKS